MNFRKMRSLITVALILIFTFSLGLSAFAESTTETATTTDSSTTTAAASTVAAPTSTTDSTDATTNAVTTPVSPTEPAASTATPSVIQKGKAKVQNIGQQIKQLKKAQVQTKKLQKLMPTAQFKQLLNQEVDRPAKAAQKKNVAGARFGVVKKIETASNGKIKILVRRGDHSKVYNNFFTFTLDPAKILVYDRQTKTQTTLNDVKVGDVVRVIPVRGASLFLIDVIAHPATTPVPVPSPEPVPTTTPDTLTVQ